MGKVDVASGEAVKTIELRRGGKEEYADGARDIRQQKRENASDVIVFIAFSYDHCRNRGNKEIFWNLLNVTTDCEHPNGKNIRSNHH